MSSPPDENSVTSTVSGELFDEATAEPGGPSRTLSDDSYAAAPGTTNADKRRALWDQRKSEPSGATNHQSLAASSGATEEILDPAASNMAKNKLLTSRHASDDRHGKMSSNWTKKSNGAIMRFCPDESSVEDDSDSGTESHATRPSASDLDKLRGRSYINLHEQFVSEAESTTTSSAASGDDEDA